MAGEGGGVRRGVGRVVVLEVLHEGWQGSVAADQHDVVVDEGDVVRALRVGHAEMMTGPTLVRHPDFGVIGAKTRHRAVQ